MEKIDFSLELLEDFIVVAQTKSLTAAARILGATQPNIGRRMAGLSKKVGLDLLVRHSRGVTLTPGGEKFLQVSQNLLGQLKYELNLIQEHVCQLQGGFKIATAIGTTGKVINAVNLLVQKYPKAKFNIQTMGDFLSELHIGRNDVGIIPNLLKDNDLIQRPIFTLKVRLYASRKYFEANAMPQSWQDLKDHHLVFCQNHDGTLDSFINFHLLNKLPDYYTSVGENMLKETLLSGLGIGPFFVSEGSQNNPLIDVFPGMPDHEISYYFTHHKRLNEDEKTKELYQLLRSH